MESPGERQHLQEADTPLQLKLTWRVHRSDYSHRLRFEFFNGHVYLRIAQIVEVEARDVTPQFLRAPACSPYFGFNERHVYCSASADAHGIARKLRTVVDADFNYVVGSDAIVCILILSCIWLYCLL
jgi:hypothetical protein